MTFVPEEPFDREVVAVAMQSAEDAGRRVGLHLEQSTVATPAEPDETGGPVLIVANFRVGDLAFTDRVLRPEVEETNKAVRVMEVDADLDELADFRRKLAEGKGPLHDLEDPD